MEPTPDAPGPSKGRDRLNGTAVVILCAILLWGVFLGVEANVPEELDEVEPETRDVGTVEVNQTGLDLLVEECRGGVTGEVMLRWVTNETSSPIVTFWCDEGGVDPWNQEEGTWNQDALMLNVTWDASPPPEGATLQMSFEPEDDLEDFPAAVLFGFLGGALIVAGAVGFAVMSAIRGRAQIAIGMGLALVTGILLMFVISFALNPCIGVCG